MKKLFKSVAIASVVLATSFFAACTYEDSSDSSNIDVLTLDAVNIKAVAYPGFNYVAWGESTTGATVKVLRDDGKVIYDGTTATTNLGLSNAEIDYDIYNGATYTYTAYVIAKGDNSEVSSANETSGSTNNYSTYITVKGNSSSASAKAIVPAYYTNGNLTTALDIAKLSGSSSFIISKSNLYFEQSSSNPLQYYVIFPVKAFLNYTYYVCKGNGTTLFDTTTGSFTNGTYTAFTTSIEPNYYTVDETYKSSAITVTAAGVYQIVVKVSADGYEDSYIVSDTITIDALDTEGASTAIKYAGYIDEGNTVRVLWTPAETASGDVYAASKYKVYLYDSVTGLYTAVSGTIREDTYADLGTCYYLDYAVADNTAAHTFYVVLSDNGNVESAHSTTVAAYVDTDTTAGISATVLNMDGDNWANDIKLVITADEDVTVTASYALYTATVGTKETLWTEISDLGNWGYTDDTTASETGYIVYLKDLAEGSYTFRVTASKSGYKTATYSDSATIAEYALTAPTLTVKQYDTGSETVYVNVSDTVDDDTETMANYTYTLYRAQYGESSTTSATSNLTLGAFTAVTTLTSSQFEYQEGEYVAVYKDTVSDFGIYEYYVLKTDTVYSVSADKVYAVLSVSDYSSNFAYNPTIYDGSATYGTTLLPTTATVDSRSYALTWKIGTTEVNYSMSPASGLNATYGTSVNIYFGKDSLYSNKYDLYAPTSAFSSITLYRATYNGYSMNYLTSGFESVTNSATAVTATATYTNLNSETVEYGTNTVMYSFSDTVSSYGYYLYVIKAVDSDGNTYYSDTFTLTPTTVAGIDN